MAYKTSTGLRDFMLAIGSAQAALANGSIRILSGAEPATADAPETGTLLCVISKDGLGSFSLAEYANNGVLGKVPGDVLSGTVLSTGQAGYYRHVGSSDTGAASSSEPRIQGRIGLSGAEGNLSSIDLVQGATQTIDEYNVALPSF